MIHLALVWHQHQPLYRDLGVSGPGSLRLPWVRLHAVRDYFSMARIVAQHPAVHLTINFSPSVLAQIEDYVEGGCTDVAWELSRVPAERLDLRQAGAVLGSFFDADWHNQIFPHPRYRELFEQRRDGRRFSTQDLRDLQVWFNLAWFGKEVREGAVALPGGATTSVAPLARKGAGYTTSDLEEVLAEQLKVMRAVIPEHRRLAVRGQIEISASPLYHPILPLLIDTDRATIDRPGATHPPRFAHPEDAEAQVARAIAAHARWFGAPPRGAWPAEGAVSEDTVPLFARHGIRWIASDQGVLARSGKWGYEAQRADVRNRVYRAEKDGAAVSILFRDTELSDDIGFRLQARDPSEAARAWVGKLKERAAEASPGADRIVTVVLDGENAWGAYGDDGRPFLHELYGALQADPEIRTVTPSEFIDGRADRMIDGHPAPSQPRVFELFTGSWIDEAGSAPGVDLGTWIGEPEENRAWTLLGQARQDLAGDLGAPGGEAVYLALLAAEGSDWFWWLGDDQDSGHDADFDDLFRLHLASAYRAAGRMVPPSVEIPLVPRDPVWTFAAPVGEIAVDVGLIVRTHCPGVVRWTSGTLQPPTGEAVLTPAGGAMAGMHRYQARLGPFAQPGELVLRFECRHPGCDCGDDARCRLPEARVKIRPRT